MTLLKLSKFRLERFVFKLEVLDFGLQDMFRFDVASNPLHVQNTGGQTLNSVSVNGIEKKIRENQRE